MWVGKLQPPWDRHTAHRDEQPSTFVSVVTAPALGGCVINGNINARGEHIYHMPGQEYYDRTIITPSKGERWFCSEEEAVAAGWRPSKR